MGGLSEIVKSPEPIQLEKTEENISLNDSMKQDFMGEQQGFMPNPLLLNGDQQIDESKQQLDMQNANVVQQLVKAEDKQQKAQDSEAILKQLLEIDKRYGTDIEGRNEEVLKLLPEYGLGTIYILFDRFEEIDNYIANKREIEVSSFDMYEMLDEELHPIVDAYLKSQMPQQVEQPKQEEERKSEGRLSLSIKQEKIEDEGEWDREETFSKRQLASLEKSKTELKKLVNINTDMLSDKALPIAKGYLKATEKFSSALAVKAAKENNRSPETKETFNALEYRYYNMLADNQYRAENDEKLRRDVDDEEKAQEVAYAERIKFIREGRPLTDDEKDMEKAELRRRAKAGKILTRRQVEALDELPVREVRLGDIEDDADIALDNINAGIDSISDEFQIDQQMSEDSKELQDVFGDIEEIKSTDTLHSQIDGKNKAEISEDMKKAIGEIKDTQIKQEPNVAPLMRMDGISTGYVEAAMSMDSWLNGDDAKSLMSEDPADRHPVLDKLVSQALKYQLDKKMFNKKSFENNSEKITEMALFFPALLELVSKENARSGYDANGKEEVLYAMRDASQELYQGYSQYAELQGLQLGNVTKSEVKVENVYDTKGADHKADALLNVARFLDQAGGGSGVLDKDEERELTDISEASMDPIYKDSTQEFMDANTKLKLSETHIGYDARLESVETAQVGYREDKKSGKKNLWEPQREELSVEQVNQAEQKVQAHLKEIKEQGGLQEEQKGDVYTQVEQEIRREAAESQREVLEHRLDMAKFDKKTTAPLSAKELKEQEKQRKKAVRRTGNRMGVTHRTGKLLSSIEQANANTADFQKMSHFHIVSPSEKKSANKAFEKADAKLAKITEKVDNLVNQLNTNDSDYKKAVDMVNYTKQNKLDELTDGRDAQIAQLDNEKAEKKAAKIEVDENKYTEAKKEIENQYQAQYKTMEAEIDSWFPAWRDSELQKLEQNHLKKKNQLDAQYAAKKKEQDEATDIATQARKHTGNLLGVQSEKSKRKATKEQAKNAMLDGNTIFRGVSMWSSEKERNTLASLSPEIQEEKAKAATIVNSILKNVSSSLKLNANSFSASFFTANAQKIMEYKEYLPNLQSLLDTFNLTGTKEEAVLKSYMNKFNQLFNGFECFLQNNGINVQGDSAYAARDYASVEDYRKSYKAQVTYNNNRLQVYYNEYCKALR
ncbi:MAG: hypothetical protein RR424_04635 [Oscillospiraceae bacterium]